MDTEEMARRGAEDAERGTPNPFYYQHYYYYRRGFDKARRRPFAWLRWAALAVALIAIIGFAGSMFAGSLLQPEDNSAAAVIPTRAPTATPRPLFPTPSVAADTQPSAEASLPDGLRVDGFATISNTVGKSLRARAEPSLKAAIQTTFKEGDRVHLLEGPVDADGLRWWRVEGPNGAGWSAERSSEGDVWLQPAT